jgi:hypothetical protein
LGLDRRYILPLLIPVFVWLVLAVVLPAIDDAIEEDVIPAGTVIELEHGVSFTTAEGWVSGPVFPNQPSVELFKDGVGFTVQSGLWDGSARELLDRKSNEKDEYRLDGPVRRVPTKPGGEGVARALYGAEQGNQGGVFAFTHDGVGVTVVVKGSTALIDPPVQDVAEMIASLDFGSEEGT